MTEHTQPTPLSPVAQKFVLHWGEMGTRWGVSRTVAQIHALLFLLGRPMHAEEISLVLQVARSNVSTQPSSSVPAQDASKASICLR